MVSFEYIRWILYEYFYKNIYNNIYIYIYIVKLEIVRMNEMWNNYLMKQIFNNENEN